MTKKRFRLFLVLMAALLLPFSELTASPPQQAGDGEPTRITAERLAPLVRHADLISKDR